MAEVKLANQLDNVVALMCDHAFEGKTDTHFILKRVGKQWLAAMTDVNGKIVANRAGRLPIVCAHESPEQAIAMVNQLAAT